MTGLARDVDVLVRLSAAIAAQDTSALQSSLRAAAESADPVAVEETILQSYLFLGYPAALNAFAAWRDVGGVEAGPESEDDLATWEERGAAVCSSVYGGQYERLRSNVRALHPDMERWMVREGYGKVLGRPGLDLATRELCIVALLAVTDMPRQLYSHLRGALNAGAEPEAVSRALGIALELAGDEAAERAEQTWASVLERAKTGG